MNASLCDIRGVTTNPADPAVRESMGLFFLYWRTPWWSVAVLKTWCQTCLYLLPMVVQNCGIIFLLKIAPQLSCEQGC